MVKENQFLFNGVGQGLFYLGNLCNDTFDFLYDYGTMSSAKTVLKRYSQRSL